MKCSLSWIEGNAMFTIDASRITMNSASAIGVRLADPVQKLLGAKLTATAQLGIIDHTESAPG